jgi:maleylpyruvate isomerase
VCGGFVLAGVRVFRIPLSTNVERVALALAHKGIEVEWVEVDPADRTPVRTLSGQDLVPVLQSDDGEVVYDSTRILEWLERRQPDPPLYPREPARRAEVEVFVDWFNRVWKRPPNELDAELSKPEPDLELAESLGREISASLDVFEGLLTGRDYLMGEFSVADCAAFPFLRFALYHEEDDPYLFHRLLIERLALDGRYPNVRAWLERMESKPRA